MLLSSLIGKKIYCSDTPRGFLLGVGVSLKNANVKYLLCTKSSTNATKNTQTDFSIASASVLSINKNIQLSKLRTLYPKSYAKLFLERPVYTEKGEFLGILTDAKMDGFILETLILDNGNSYPFSSIIALSDAIILQKPPVYPLGQRVPAYALAKINEKATPFVSKRLLKRSIDKGRIVELTLSLPPFSL